MLKVANIGQSAVLTVKIDPVPYHKFISDLKTHIIDVNFSLKALWLKQQRTASDRGRLSCSQSIHNVAQRQARIHDVFKNNDMPVLQWLVDIQGHLDFTR